MEGSRLGSVEDRLEDKGLKLSRELRSCSVWWMESVEDVAWCVVCEVWVRRVRSVAAVERDAVTWGGAGLGPGLRVTERRSCGDTVHSG